ncbi:hypothetical protein AB0F20_29925 [Streptomyces goshikiensis]|uniref:hypothetical protein n=1 Tax=Streptomyces goshikiensis TaxID=1942 RepID=UPI0033F1F4AC
MPEQAYAQVPEGQPVVANLGMGVDSSAIVTRWLLEPRSRGFDLDQLTILIASVGEEYQQTKDAVEQALFPLIARHRVRTVQVARAGQSAKEGYVVLDDTRTPTRLVTNVPVTLGGRMLDAGTVPQVSSTRRWCSDWIKHLPLDSWLADNVAHAPFVHVIGYSAEEGRRAQRDLDGNKGHRRPDFPLLRWNWDRKTSSDYLRAAHGREFVRSSCYFCPFQHSLAGREALAANWRAEPEAALRALLIEHNALVMNPNAQLFGRHSAHEFVRAAGLHHILQRHHDRLAQLDWSIYEVRRVYHASKDGPSAKGHAYRSVEPLETGSRAAMTALLADLAAEYGSTVEVDEHGIARASLRRAGTSYPTAEHALAVGPALALAKERETFDAVFAEVTQGATSIAARRKQALATAA